MAMPEKLKVLQVGMGWYPKNQGNGLDRVFYELNQHFPASEVDACSLVVSSPDVREQSLAVVDESLSLPRRLGLARQAFREMVGQVDLVASHFALYTWPLLGLLGRKPLVVHFHGPWANESAVEGASAPIVWAKKLVERRVYTRADKLIVLSTAFRDVLSRDYGIASSNIAVVPGGVDLGRFTADVGMAEARDELAWPRQRPILLAVRRLVKRVGLDTLVEATASVRERHPEILVMIGGRGPYEATLREMVERFDLQDNVAFLGFVPEETLPTVYAAADASVVPTASLEGFGLIAAESLASGTPAFVTPVGGLPEVVADLSSNLVFDAASAPAIADKITNWLDGKIPLPSAEECRAFAEERYNWNEVARRTREVYVDALGATDAAG